MAETTKKLQLLGKFPSSGSGGTVDEETVKNAVEEYLADNPPGQIINITIEEV